MRRGKLHRRVLSVALSFVLSTGLILSAVPAEAWAAEAADVVVSDSTSGNGTDSVERSTENGQPAASEDEKGRDAEDSTDESDKNGEDHAGGADADPGNGEGNDAGQEPGGDTEGSEEGQPGTDEGAGGEQPGTGEGTEGEEPGTGEGAEGEQPGIGEGTEGESPDGPNGDIEGDAGQDGEEDGEGEPDEEETEDEEGPEEDGEETEELEEEDPEGEEEEASKKTRAGDVKVHASDEAVAPAFGEITEDTTWTEGTLRDGTVTVKEGVTLKLTGRVRIFGTVTFEGGGTIERDNEDAYFDCNDSAVWNDIILDGNNVESIHSMIYGAQTVRTPDTTAQSIVLNEGCTIQNCINKAVSAYSGGNGGAVEISSGALPAQLIIKGATIRNCHASKCGGAIYFSSIGASGLEDGSLLIEDVTIEECSAQYSGGAISATRAYVTINNGMFRNNKTTSAERWSGVSGGGCIEAGDGTLTINGGNFIGNESVYEGGCIYHYAFNGNMDTRTYINGGYFEGNKCTNEQFRGSGAIYIRSTDANSVYVKGNVRFVGDGTDGSGTDGIYLSKEGGGESKIWLTDTIYNPVTVYLPARVGYVLAQGAEYKVSTDDKNNIKFVNVSDDGTEYYSALNTLNNQVYLSTTKPDDTTAEYRVEHYLQNLDGKDYTRADADTQQLPGTVGHTVTAEPNEYTGFTENTSHESRKITGMVTETRVLVLAFYYDRIPYQINFDSNDGSRAILSTQTVLWGNYVTKPDDPVREGFTFGGWYKDQEGTEANRWNFDATVENNTTEQTVTLYAKWIENESKGDDDGGGTPPSGDEGDDDGGGTPPSGDDGDDDGGGTPPGGDDGDDEGGGTPPGGDDGGNGGGTKPTTPPTPGSKPTDHKTSTVNTENTDTSTDSLHNTETVVNTTVVNVTQTAPAPPTSRDREPKTGTQEPPWLYATIGMIAGLSYIMLLFTEDRGMTEERKKELIARMIVWAKSGGILRRMLAFAGILILLVYYHSIGKQQAVEWRVVYETYSFKR